MTLKPGIVNRPGVWKHNGEAVQVATGFTAGDAVVLTSGSTAVDGNTAVTASITPPAGKWVFAMIGTSKATGTPPAATLSGNGMGWFQVGGSATSGVRTALLVGIGSGTPGIVTITATASTGFEWCIGYIDHVATEDGAGFDAVLAVEGTSGTDTGGTYILTSASGTGDNGILSVFRHGAEESTSPGAGRTELADVSHASPSTGFEVQWWPSDGGTGEIAASWPTSQTYLALGAEIAYSGS